MSVSHLLEDFGAFTLGNVVEITDVSLEEERLEAFEKGYTAGWDDSAAANDNEVGQVSREIAQTLADMSFTYEEACAGLLKGLRPVVDQIVRTILPRVAEDTLMPRVSEMISALIAEHGRLPIEIGTTPTTANQLGDLTSQLSDLPLKIHADPEIQEGQLWLKIGKNTEQEIDLAQTISQISSAIDAHFNSATTSDQRNIA